MYEAKRYDELFVKFEDAYHIRPSNSTVRLGFQNYLEHLVVLKHASTYLGYIIKKIRKGHLMMIMRFSFLIFFMKAYIVSTCRCNSNEYTQDMSL